MKSRAGASILYVDCFAGVAGDMMLGALLDLGDDVLEAATSAVEALPLQGYRLVVDGVRRSGISATQVRVEVDPTDQPHRSFSTIRALIEDASVDPEVAERATAIFAALAEAEAAVHDVPVDEVHFHEVGAVDSIVDVVGIAAGLVHLGGTVHSARVPLGRGFVDCQHGTLPVPAPATMELVRGLPVAGTDLDAELVTPTGAAVLKTQVECFGPLPPMRPERVGWGAGSRDHPDRPGLLRLVAGEPLLEARPSACVVLEANIDDMTAELAAHFVEQALAAGALDAWVSPVVMKKGRPAMQVGLLARRAELEAMAELLLTETTSIGLRYHEVGRVELPRQMVTAETPWGQVPVKVSGRPGGPRTVSPEYEACRQLALDHGVPLKEVFAVATAAALAGGASREASRGDSAEEESGHE